MEGSKLDGTTASITPRASSWKGAWVDQQSRPSCTENKQILRRQQATWKEKKLLRNSYNSTIRTCEI